MVNKEVNTEVNRLLCEAPLVERVTSRPSFPPDQQLRQRFPLRWLHLTQRVEAYLVPDRDKPGFEVLWFSGTSRS